MSIEKDNNILYSLNNISYQLLSELMKSKKPLSIYDFDKKYSPTQYRYWSRKLESNLIVISSKNGKRLHYRINDYCKKEVRKILNLRNGNMERSPLNLPRSLKEDKRFFHMLNLLEGTKNWAFADTTALLMWVPFLDLHLPRYTISVKDKTLKNKFEENFPSSLLEVVLLPSYFIRTSGISLVNNIPVLKPESLFFRLLKHESERVRLSALFLLPYLSQRVLMRYLHNNMEQFPSLAYSLLTLRTYFQEYSQNSYLRIVWFFNLDQFDLEELLGNYLTYCGKKGLKKTFKTVLNRYELMRIKVQQRTDDWNVWDRTAMLFPKRNLTFDPSSFMELTTLSEPVVAS